MSFLTIKNSYSASQDDTNTSELSNSNTKDLSNPSPKPLNKALVKKIETHVQSTSLSSSVDLKAAPKLVLNKGRSTSLTNSMISKKSALPAVSKSFVMASPQPTQELHKIVRRESSPFDEIMPFLKANFDFIQEHRSDPNKKEQVIKALSELSKNVQTLLKAHNETSEMATVMARRPGSMGLNLSDIDDFLFDEKVCPSEDHKIIADFIRGNLLKVNKDIPVRGKCNPKRSTNAANLLKWVDEENLSDSPILNLYLYREALTSLKQLMEKVRDEIETDHKIPEISDEKNKFIQNLEKKFNVAQKVANQFYDINVCLGRAFGDEDENQNDTNAKAETSYFSMRYREIIDLYNIVIKNIEKRIQHMLSKEKRFQIYFVEEREKKILESKGKDNELELDRRALNSFGKNGSLGSIGQHALSFSMKLAGKTSEWEYILNEDALNIFDSNATPLLSVKKETLNSIDGVRLIFCNFMDVLFDYLKLNPSEFAVLKDYFLLGRQLENDFNLCMLLENLGFQHYFGLSPQQLKELQEKFIQEKADLTRLKKVIKSMNPQLEKFLFPLCSALSTKLDVKKPVESICLQFEKMCQILYLIEADEKNSKREDFLKLLTILKLINQDTAYTYIAKTLNAMHIRIAGKKMFCTLKPQPGEKPNKKFEMAFKNGQFIFRGKGKYSVEIDGKKSKHVVKETFMLTVPIDQLLDPSKWRESYFVAISLKAAPSKEEQEHLDLFQINLFKNNIPYKMKKLYSLEK